MKSSLQGNGNSIPLYMSLEPCSVSPGLHVTQMPYIGLVHYMTLYIEFGIIENGTIVFFCVSQQRLTLQYSLFHRSTSLYADINNGLEMVYNIQYS